MRSTVIPFSGFYYSWHDDAIDRALDSLMQDTAGDPFSGLVRRAFDLIWWPHVHEAYAKAYAENFAREFGIAGLEFEELVSPREYNFTTDRIFVKIPDSEIDRIFDSVNAETLHGVAREMFTSRSGFISFYSPRFGEWGPLDDWDHNQLYALITAHVLESRGDGFDEAAEFDLMESDRGNGRLEDWIYEAARDKAQMDRLLNVADYLRRREERSF